jgi:hypothetical protein
MFPTATKNTLSKLIRYAEFMEQIRNAVIDYACIKNFWMS